MGERAYTLSELCRITGRSRVTLRQWCLNGKISAQKDEERLYVPASEVFRVFPNITPADIEKGLHAFRRPLEKLEQPNHDAGQDMAAPDLKNLQDELADKERTIAVQQTELERLRTLLSSVQEQLKLLQEMKALLVEQLKTKDDQFAVIGRLITEHSSAPRKTSTNDQPRDGNGRFAKKTGNGVNALFEQGNLVAGDDQAD